jgi:hypothetical protein
MRIEAAGCRLVQVASFEAKERKLQPKWRGSGEGTKPYGDEDLVEG